ncbi:MAG: hypothetical protein ACON35_02300 [Candidatus Marinamargulisbacteria bacterium]
MSVRGFLSKLSTNSSANKYKVDNNKPNKTQGLSSPLNNCGTPVNRNDKKNILNGLNPIANPLNVRHDDDPTNIGLDIGEINMTENECRLENTANELHEKIQQLKSNSQVKYLSTVGDDTKIYKEKNGKSLGNPEREIRNKNLMRSIIKGKFDKLESLKWDGTGETLQESSKETIKDIRIVCDDNKLLSFNQGDDDEFAIINHLFINIDNLEQELKDMIDNKEG